MNINVREADESDIADIVKYVRELAEYENMSEYCVITEEMFYNMLFNEHSINALIAEADGVTVGIAIYHFYKISTFSGRKILYLEDVYITPDMRNSGIGTEFFKKLKSIAKDTKCSKIEWKCLKWNEPSIKFYDNKIGGLQDNEWINYYIPDTNF